jgi:transcription elongation factor GreA
MAEHHLSQAAYDRLKAEHHDLTTRWRIDISKKIEAAREMGDLKENGDYHAAKEEQGKTEARIAQLAALIEDAVIVEAGDSDVVMAGSIVGVSFAGDDDVDRYLVGSIEERSDDVEVLTPGSPLGESLMGASVGDEVEFEAPAGVLKVKIVSID